MSGMYPKWRYHAKYEALLVMSAEHDDAIGEGWADNPSAFGRDVANAPDAIRFILSEFQASRVLPSGTPKETRKYQKRGEARS